MGNKGSNEKATKELSPIDKEYLDILNCYNNTGLQIKDWDEDTFKDVLKAHVKEVWGPGTTIMNRIGYYGSALSTILSAILNLWYLMDTAAELERDSSQHYNLTQWVVVLIEVAVVYAFAVRSLLSFCRLFSSEPDLVDFDRWIHKVGSVSAFTLLTQLNAATLKKVFEYVQPMFIRSWRRLKEFCQTIKVFKKEFGCFPVLLYLYLLLCCSPCLLLGGIMWIISWFVYPVFVIFFVGLGPTALLLKIRQVSFVSTLYIRYWGTQQWLSFFGFANNVAGLSKSEVIRIKSFQRVLFMTENGETSKRLFQKLLAKALMDPKFKKLNNVTTFRAWMLLNSWFVDPERFVRLLRAMEPKKPEEEKK